MGQVTGWAWFFGGLLVVGVVLMIAVVVRIVAGGVRRTGAPDDRTSAQRLLEERYARGEISAEEYELRRRVLGEAP